MRVITDLTGARNFLSRLHGGPDVPLSPKVVAGIERVFGEPLSLPEAVSRILDDVRTKGDAALFDYLRRIDGLSPTAWKSLKATSMPPWTKSPLRSPTP